jgi:hypothetical protein
LKRTTTLFVTALLVLTSHLTPASASPLTWTFSGATFNDGGTLSGSFVYDADQSLFSGIPGEFLSGTITTTSGSISFGETYNVGVDALSGNNLYLYDYFPGNIDESVGIFFASPPTDAGGTINITYAFERRDNNTNGQQNLFFVAANSTSSAGVITARSAPSSTPEPDTVVPAAGVLLILAGRFRRASRVYSI